MVGRYYRHIESKLLLSSDSIVAISGKFVSPLKKWGVRADRITVIANWAPLSEIRPVAKDNPWSRRHGLHDKTVALYTGTLGLKHDPSLLLALAHAGERVGLHLAVVSEGPGADWLADRKRESGLTNLTVLPFQPMKTYSEVLGAGDILLAMVGAEAAAFSVPSKILSYLAAGKCVVASIAGDNDAALMIAEASAGAVVEPDDREAFVDKVLELAVDPELRETMGEKARRFAVDRFAIEAIGDRFEAICTAIKRPKAAPSMTRLSRLSEISG
jgi:glycosyltransferase involved in cell wall biosynthesis